MPYNPYYRNGRRRGLYNIRRRMNSVDWNAYTLTKFDKVFYRERSSVRERSRRAVEEFRSKNIVTVLGHNVLRPLFKFSEAGFPSYLMDVIKKKQWEKPTPVQSQSWPVVLSGRDLVGIVQPNLGKTATFMLPAIVHAKAQPSLKHGDGPIVLVLVPSKESAKKIKKEFTEFCESADFRIVCLYGGSSKSAQVSELSRSPEFVVATPKRFLDLLESRKTNLKRCSYLVVDKANKMLDKGYELSLRRIASQVRPDRQTLLWSSSWPREVKSLAENFLYDYVQINVGSPNSNVCNIRQIVEVIDESERFKRLRNILQTFDHCRVLLFTESRKHTDEISQKLIDKGFNVLAIHGNEEEKESILESYHNDRMYIYVSSDAAMKGLKIDDVRYVINYDYPSHIEDYLNRNSKVNRKDKLGQSYTFFTSKQSGMARELLATLNDTRQKVPPELIRLADRRPRDRRRAFDRFREGNQSFSNRNYLRSKDRKESLSSNRSVSTDSRSRSRSRSHVNSENGRENNRANSNLNNKRHRSSDRNRSVSKKTLSYSGDLKRQICQSSSDHSGSRSSSTSRSQNRKRLLNRTRGSNSSRSPSRSASTVSLCPSGPRDMQDGLVDEDANILLSQPDIALTDKSPTSEFYHCEVTSPKLNQNERKDYGDRNWKESQDRSLKRIRQRSTDRSKSRSSTSRSSSETSLKRIKT